MDSFIFNPCGTTNINEISNSNSNMIQVYPNPTINQVNIKQSKELSIFEINVYDINGKMVSNFKIINNQISLASHASGLYYVKFNTNKGILTKKIILK